MENPLAVVLIDVVLIDVTGDPTYMPERRRPPAQGRL